MYLAATVYYSLFILFTFSFAVFFGSTETRGQSGKGNWVEAEDLNRQAILRTAEKRFPEAIALLEKAVKLEPLFAEAHMNIGSAYMLSGQPETALVHLKRGIEIDPNSHKGYNQLGVVYDKLGKPDQAIDHLKKAIELEPDYALGHFNLGAAYLFSNRLKPAQEALERAAKLDPANNDIRLTLGVAYAKQSRYSEAIAEVKHVTKQQPDDDKANLILCRIYLLAKDRESALNMYQAVKAVNLPLAAQMFKSIFSDKIVYVGK